MDSVLEQFKAFIVAVKDDPAGTDTFRVAANELHGKLEAAGKKPARKPKADTAVEPDEG